MILLCLLAIPRRPPLPLVHPQELLTLPLPRKSRRRRRRRTRRSANENSAPRSATPVTPDERWANQNSVSQRATQHQPEASDPTQMKSAPVYKGQSIHSPHPTQPPIPATNRNSAFPFGLECCEFPGLYKPALPDLKPNPLQNPQTPNLKHFHCPSQPSHHHQLHLHHLPNHTHHHLLLHSLFPLPAPPLSTIPSSASHSTHSSLPSSQPPSTSAASSSTHKHKHSKHKHKHCSKHRDTTVPKTHRERTPTC